MAAKKGNQFVFFDKKNVIRSPNVDTALKIGERIASLVEASKRSQRQLSKTVPGLNHSAMGAIVRGERDPQLSTLTLIADALGVTLPELVAGIKTTVIGDLKDERRTIRMLDVRLVSELENKATEPVGYTVVPADKTPIDVKAAQMDDDSMSGAFEDGDVVYFSSAREPRPGDVVIARASGKTVLRHYIPVYSNSGSVIKFELAPEQRTWPRVTCDKSNPGSVVGVVVGKLHLS